MIKFTFSATEHYVYCSDSGSCSSCLKYSKHVVLELLKLYWKWIGPIDHFNGLDDLRWAFQSFHGLDDLIWALWSNVAWNCDKQLRFYNFFVNLKTWPRESKWPRPPQSLFIEWGVAISGRHYPASVLVASGLRPQFVRGSPLLFFDLPCTAFRSSLPVPIQHTWMKQLMSWKDCSLCASPLSMH